MRSMLNTRGPQASRRVAKSGINGPPYRPAIFWSPAHEVKFIVTSAQPLGDWCSSRAANRTVVSWGLGRYDGIALGGDYRISGDETANRIR